MSWLDRIRGTRAPTAQAPEPVAEADPALAGVERSAPGVAELFAGLAPGGCYSILDLGAASESHLRLYGEYARHVRFADLLTRPPTGKAWLEAVESMPPPGTTGYDVILAWNVLDRVSREERTALVRTLVRHTAPGARLYAVVDASGAPTVEPLRFTLQSLDRVVQEVVGPPEPAREGLLPAQMERLLAPFTVVRAFTLKLKLREYVAVRPAEDVAMNGSDGATGGTRPT